MTVGNEPCDRLVQALDNWFANHRSGRACFAQIGDGKYLAKSCEYSRFLSPSQYKQQFEQSSLIVSHAGMGTIIAAITLHKPIVVMPRRAILGETRNEHQLATVNRFHRSKQIILAESEVELPNVLNRVMNSDLEELKASIELEPSPPDESLISFERHFVS